MTKESGVGTLVFIRGIPGAGKSWLAAHLVELLGESAVKIDPDDYRYKGEAMGKDNQSSDRETLFDTLKTQALINVQAGKVVIWDQAWTSLRAAKETFAFVKKAIYPAQILLIEVNIDSKMAWGRIQERSARGDQSALSREKFDTYVDKYQSVQDEDVGVEVLPLNGDEETIVNLALICAAIQRIGKV
jgi:predicted kinase